MGSIHNQVLKALSAAYGIEMVAIADIREEKRKNGLRLWPGANGYETGMELLEKETIDVVHICLPSYLHAEHAIFAMKKGIAVMSEKPVCLTEVDCGRLLKTEKETGVPFMVGHVVRFYPEYRYLKQVYLDKTFGDLRRITMKRHGGHVAWGWQDWFNDEQKSGSVMLDLHVHDVDYLRSILGEPEILNVYTDTLKGWTMPVYVRSDLRFGKVRALVEGEWDVSSSYVFGSEFVASFDGATVAYSSKAHPSLTVYPKEGKSYSPSLMDDSKSHGRVEGINVSDLGPYYSEIKYFVEKLVKKEPIDDATLLDGIGSVRLVLKEKSNQEIHV
jgi:predicted dehydrogenase